MLCATLSRTARSAESSSLFDVYARTPAFARAKVDNFARWRAHPDLKGLGGAEIRYRCPQWSTAVEFTVEREKALTGGKRLLILALRHSCPSGVGIGRPLVYF